MASFVLRAYVNWRAWISPARLCIYMRKRRGTGKANSESWGEHPIECELITAFHGPRLCWSALPRRLLVPVCAIVPIKRTNVRAWHLTKHFEIKIRFSPSLSNIYPDSEQLWIFLVG